jgi:tetratricopeptide (TPR) repeat protein
VAADPALAKEVARIVADHADPRARAAAALRLVQDETRYLFEGMGEGNYVPQPPTKTWQVRYGDCKAKTLLLLAMLHEMGIEAEPVMANLSYGDWLPERLPSFGAFDHVLVRASVAGKTLWLDGTGSGTRVEDLEDTPPFAFVLPVRATGADLEPIVTRPIARPMIVSELELDQSAGISFPVPYKLTVTMRGAAVEALRLASANSTADQIRDLVTPIATQFTNNGSVVSPSISFDDAAATVRVTATGLANIFWRKEAGKRQVILDTVATNFKFDPNRSKPEWRSIPVATAYPVHNTVRTRLRLPRNGKGFVLDGEMDASETIAGYDLRRSYQLENDWITIDQTIASRNREVPAELISATRERLAIAKNRAARAFAPDDYPRRLEEVREAKASGAFQPMLKLLTQAIAEEPDEAHHYRNRATLLAAIHERSKAVADLDQMIKLQPDASTYLWRAELREKLGDFAGVSADLAKAKELDPASERAFLQYLDLQVDRGDTDAALAAVDQRLNVAGRDKADLMIYKAMILAEAGKIDEALTLSDAAVAERPGQPKVLNRRCELKAEWKVSLDTALKDCTKAIELMEDPVAPLTNRALVYYRLGRGAEAMEDLDAAYEINSMYAPALFLRSIVRQMRGDASGAEADLAAARQLDPGTERTYARYGIKP